MAIEFTDEEIVITDGDYRLADIVEACDDDSIVEVTNGIYAVNKSIILGEVDSVSTGARLVMLNEVLKGTVDKLVTHAGSILRLGETTAEGASILGSRLELDGITEFGGDGDLRCYGSQLIVRCEWTWAQSITQLIELHDCYIDGYGKVSGILSSVVRCNVLRDNYKGGLIITEVSEVDDIRDVYKTSDDTVAIVVNGDIELAGTTYDGYKTLVKSNAGVTRLVNCELLNGYTCELTNGAEVNVVYSVDLRCVDAEGVTLEGEVELVRSDGVKIVEQLIDGMLIVELVTKLITEGAVEDYTYVVVKDGTSRRIDVDGQMNGVLHIGDGMVYEVIDDYSKIMLALDEVGLSEDAYAKLDEIVTAVDDIEATDLSGVTSKLALIEGGVVQVLSNVATIPNSVVIDNVTKIEV